MSLSAHDISSLPGLGPFLIFVALYAIVLLVVLGFALAALFRGRRRLGVGMLIALALYGLGPWAYSTWRGAQADAQLAALEIRPEPGEVRTALHGARLLLICGIDTCSNVPDMALKGGVVGEVYRFDSFGHAMWTPGQGTHRPGADGPRPNGSFWRDELVPDPYEDGATYDEMTRVEALPPVDVSLYLDAVPRQDKAGAAALGLAPMDAKVAQKGFFLFRGGMPLSPDRLIARALWGDHKQQLMFLPFLPEWEATGDYARDRQMLQDWLCTDAARQEVPICQGP